MPCRHRTPEGWAGVWAFRESFNGRSPTRPQGGEPSSVLVSHYKGDSPAAWKTRLETFDSLDLGEP